MKIEKTIKERENMSSVDNSLGAEFFNELNLFCYLYDEDSNSLSPMRDYTGVFQVREMLKIVDELKKKGISYEVNHDESISIFQNS